MCLSGKCSHGGSFDKTSSKEPTGGINKDDISSEHGSFHLRAAEMAIIATMELLEDIRLATGEQVFLRYEYLYCMIFPLGTQKKLYRIMSRLYISIK